MKKAIEKARKHAKTLERIAARSKPRPRSEKNEALLKKVARKLRMIYYGPKYHATVTKPKKKKPKKTAASLLVNYARKSGYRK